MAKVIDITAKLSAAELPKICIRGEELEVNNDAETVLKLMGMVNNGFSNEDVLVVLDLLFPAESRSKLADMKLKFKDYLLIASTAMDLAVDAGEDGVGEDETHTTT